MPELCHIYVGCTVKVLLFPVMFHCICGIFRVHLAVLGSQEAKKAVLESFVFIH